MSTAAHRGRKPSGNLSAPCLGGSLERQCRRSGETVLRLLTDWNNRDHAKALPLLRTRKPRARICRAFSHAFFRAALSVAYASTTGSCVRLRGVKSIEGHWSVVTSEGAVDGRRTCQGSACSDDGRSAGQRRKEETSEGAGETGLKDRTIFIRAGGVVAKPSTAAIERQLTESQLVWSVEAEKHNEAKTFATTTGVRQTAKPRYQG